MGDFTAIIRVLLFAAHLLAMNVPSMAPLICIWLHARGRRGDAMANVIGQRLAKASLCALVIGTLLGMGLAALRWADPDRAYWEAVQRFPAQAYHFALGELAFTAVCLVVYIATWHRWHARPWLHAFVAVLATTNLLYHFPPLMVALGNLAARPHLIQADTITRPIFRDIIMGPEMLAQVLHFVVASVAVSGLALMLIAHRVRDMATSDETPDRLIASGARIALAATVAQLAVGAWVLVQLPATARWAVLGDDWLAGSLFFLSVVAAFGVLHSLLGVALGNTSGVAVRRTAVLMLTVVLLMSGSQTRARQIDASRSNDTPLSHPPHRNHQMNSNIVEIKDQTSGSTARILVSLGFNCFSWRPVLAEGPREMLWADGDFHKGDKRPSGNGIPLLFPFPGRIGGTTFRFQGREYPLEPGDAFGNAIHGFVYNRSWRVVEQNENRVVGEFQASVDDPTILDRWPADFRIRVSYEVRDRELVSDIRYENTGSGPLPCGFATHAYFRLPLAEGGSAAGTIVTVPVDDLWELDNMIPTGKKLPAPPDQRLADGLPLGDHKFDTCFTGVQADADNLVRTRLSDPTSGRVVTQTFDRSFTQCVVYTPPHREAICIEPYTCVPDAVRLAAEGHDTGLQILQPGEFRQTTVRIDVNR